ncbi:serine hydrolase domain-containing protein, partial [Streptomyces sp. NPDC047014]|uniref:serine hydrolase domain-containing protein n=1 Tax=Streptomyces sp. NPDC047014 TaxID=3155736 RepID=UPI0033BFC3B8
MRTWSRRARAAAVAAGLLLVPAGTATAYEALAAPPAAAPTPTPTAPPTPAPTGSAAAFPELTPAVAARLDAAIQQVMRETGVPGATVGLWTPGKGSYLKSFGVADKTTRAPMDPGLGMRIGSETKTFTVTALLRLVDQKKLGLDDPIGRYVSGVPDGDRITLRQLAGMRSGLYNYSEDPDFDKDFEAA